MSRGAGPVVDNTGSGSGSGSRSDIWNGSGSGYGSGQDFLIKEILQLHVHVFFNRTQISSALNPVSRLPFCSIETSPIQF